jgi:hypothetical protein
MAMLAKALASWLFAKNLRYPNLTAAAMQDRLKMLWPLAEQLSEPGTKAAVQRALEQLATREGQQGPLATAEQVQYACCRAIVRFILTVLHDTGVSGSPGRTSLVTPASIRILTQQQLTWLLAVRDRATALMLHLQPANPIAWEFAAFATLQPTNPSPRGLELCARALELAEEQGTLLSRASATVQALGCFAISSANAPPPLTTSVAAARLALAALDSLPAELERSRRMLPVQWVTGVEASIQQAQHIAPVVRAMLAGNPSAWQEIRAPLVFASTACAGCGRTAIGLRACSCCHSTKYCR